MQIMTIDFTGTLHNPHKTAYLALIKHKMGNEGAMDTNMDGIIILSSMF